VNRDQTWLGIAQIGCFRLGPADAASLNILSEISKALLLPQLGLGAATAYCHGGRMARYIETGELEYFRF
jgi:hypothetical protein